MDSHKALSDGVKAHEAGDLGAANKLYACIPQGQPEYPDAQNLLGVIRQQTGDLEQALNHFDTAISALPNEPLFHFNKGNLQRELGRLDDARASYVRTLELDSAHNGAALNLGALLVADKEFAEATRLFAGITARDPGNPSAYLNLGKCLHIEGRAEDAYRALRKAADLDPNNAETHLAIARLLRSLNNLDKALTAAQTAASVNPQWADAHHMVALIQYGLGAFDAARQASATAIKIDPNDNMKLAWYAFICNRSGDPEEGLSKFELLIQRPGAPADAFVGYAEVLRGMSRPWDALQVLDRAPDPEDTPSVLLNIGTTLQDAGMTGLAIPFFERARDSGPSKIAPIETLAFRYLQLGRLGEGWEALHTRLDLESFETAFKDGPPFWRGEDLTHKTLLVVCEQGAGEHILQLSMAKSIAPHVKRCIVECANRLAPIAQRAIPNVEIISGTDQTAAEKARREADFQLPGMNAGRYVRSSWDAFPSNERQILLPDQDKAGKFREKYEKLANGRRIIGIAWLSGSSNFGDKKSVPMEELARIFDAEKFFLVSLQYGSVANSVEKFRAKTGVEIFVEDSFDQIKDLESFFAQVASLDLVVTISNTTAHVAGAIGIPTWLMLPNGSGSLWYWFIDRADSPWYPAVEIFRDTGSPGRRNRWWEPVFESVKTRLAEWHRSSAGVRG